jgi:hypothetical protein
MIPSGKNFGCMRPTMTRFIEREDRIERKTS